METSKREEFLPEEVESLQTKGKIKTSGYVQPVIAKEVEVVDTKYLITYNRIKLESYFDNPRFSDFILVYLRKGYYVNSIFLSECSKYWSVLIEERFPKDILHTTIRYFDINWNEIKITGYSKEQLPSISREELSKRGIVHIKTFKILTVKLHYSEITNETVEFVIKAAYSPYAKLERSLEDLRLLMLLDSEILLKQFDEIFRLITPNIYGAASTHLSRAREAAQPYVENHIYVPIISFMHTADAINNHKVYRQVIDAITEDDTPHSKAIEEILSDKSLYSILSYDILFDLFYKFVYKYEDTDSFKLIELLSQWSLDPSPLPYGSGTQVYSYELEAERGEEKTLHKNHYGPGDRTLAFHELLDTFDPYEVLRDSGNSLVKILDIPNLSQSSINTMKKVYKQHLEHEQSQYQEIEQ